MTYIVVKNIISNQINLAEKYKKKWKHKIGRNASAANGDKFFIIYGEIN
jgi:hypothetical protein